MVPLDHEERQEVLAAMDDQVGQVLQVGLVLLVPLDDRARLELEELQASLALADPTDSLDLVLSHWPSGSTLLRR